jgi:hypothetical protein
MSWQPPASEGFDLEAEFRHTMGRLIAKAIELRTDRLLDKGHKEGLSSDERRELQYLLEHKNEAVKLNRRDSS